MEICIYSPILFHIKTHIPANFSRIIVFDKNSLYLDTPIRRINTTLVSKMNNISCALLRTI